MQEILVINTLAASVESHFLQPFKLLWAVIQLERFIQPLPPF